MIKVSGQMAQWCFEDIILCSNFSSSKRGSHIYINVHLIPPKINNILASDLLQVEKLEYNHIPTFKISH
jgi:hypothetical protein